MKLIAYIISFTFISGSAVAMPSKDDFFYSLYSQAFFLEQCVSNNVIRDTDIQNKLIRKSEQLGFPLSEYWDAAKNGADRIVFDMIRQKWVKLPLNKKHCNFVSNEQKKFFKTLSRY